MQLLEEIKKINYQLDDKLSRRNSFKTPMRTVFYTDEQRILSELECNQKMIKNYELEIKSLKKQIENKTGSDKIVQLLKEIEKLENEYKALQDSKKQLENNVNSTGKILSKTNAIEVKEAAQTEETSIFSCIKAEREKTKFLDSRLQSELETDKKKCEQIKILEEKIKELENELKLLKTENPDIKILDEIKETSEKPMSEEVQKMNNEISKITQEISNQIKNHNNEREKLKCDLENFKDEFDKIDKVFFTKMTI